MTVYVDDVFIPAKVGRLDARWCHMTADTPDELHAFAARIGLRRSWAQHEGTWKEHYDVTEGRRAAAVRAGAVEITWREGAAQGKARREGVPFDLATLRATSEPTAESRTP